MVSFQCEACSDVIKKPKLEAHYGRCGAPVSCIDCSKTFSSPAQFKSHTSCMTEAEKYEKTLYKGPRTQPAPSKPVVAEHVVVAQPTPQTFSQPHQGRPVPYHQQRPVAAPVIYRGRNDGSPNFMPLGAAERTFGSASTSAEASPAPATKLTLAPESTSVQSKDEENIAEIAKAERKRLKTLQKQEKKAAKAAQITQVAVLPAETKKGSIAPAEDVPQTELVQANPSETSKKSKKRKHAAETPVDPNSPSPATLSASAVDSATLEPTKKKSKKSKTVVEGTTVTPASTVAEGASELLPSKKEKKKLTQAADIPTIAVTSASTLVDAEILISSTSGAIVNAAADLDNAKSEKKSKKNRSSLGADMAATTDAPLHEEVNGAERKDKKDKKKKKSQVDATGGEALVAAAVGDLTIDGSAAMDDTDARKKRKMEKKARKSGLTPAVTT